MRKLNMLEHKRETNLDAIAGLTGEMLGEIFAWKMISGPKNYIAWDFTWASSSI